MVRRTLTLALTAAAVAAVAGCGPSDVGTPAAAGPAASPATTPERTTPATTPAKSTKSSTDRGVSGFRSPRDYRSVAEPVRIRIPSKGIDSTLAHVGKAADGTVDAPDEWQQAAWYDKGPRPGQEGPAVIVGHVDSKQGKAVFFRLGELRAGDDVYVDQADGRTAHFTVTTRRQFPKSRFPADLIYSPTLQSSLQLLTCGGVFNSHTGHYLDNIVVSAVPA